MNVMPYLAHDAMNENVLSVCLNYYNLAKCIPWVKNDPKGRSSDKHKQT